MVDPWLPVVGSEIALPMQHVLPDAPRRGIVVNLADMRLYYFRDDEWPPQTFPIGIGHGVNRTPTGVTWVTARREDPTWIPPPSLRAAEPGLPAAIGPGPDNPLGAFALNLGWPNYVIHGTNRPYGIGRQVSGGCIRLYPDHIAVLFARVAVGTPVTIVDQPVKLGWFGGELYLEMHPTQSEAEAVESGRPFARGPIPGLVQLVLHAAGAENRTARLAHNPPSRIRQARRAGAGVSAALVHGCAGAVRQVDDLVGYAAEHKVSCGAEAPGTHDDEIGGVLFGT